MNKTVEVIVTRKEKCAVEVEFPVYRKHDMDSPDGESVFYSRIDADMRQVTVHLQTWTGHTHYELEIDSNVDLSGSDADYALGKGQYACTAAEFNKALEAAIKVAESMRLAAG